MTSTLDLNTIFSRTVNLVSERFGYYHAAIFLVDESGFNVVSARGHGRGRRRDESPPAQPARQREFDRRARYAHRGEPSVVNDTRRRLRRTIANPLLPETRAECAIPLRVGNRIIGALDIQARTDVGAFSPTT